MVPVRHGLYAVVFIPVMFALLLAALLGSSPSSAKTCGAGYSASGGSLPLLNLPSCLPAEKTAAQKKASVATHGSCIATAPGAASAAWTGGALAFSPSAQASTAAEDSAETC